jgi:hypothetical protein
MEACEPITAAMDVFGVGAILREALAAFAELLPDDLRPWPRWVWTRR